MHVLRGEPHHLLQSIEFVVHHLSKMIAVARPRNPGNDAIHGLVPEGCMQAWSAHAATIQNQMKHHMVFRIKLAARAVVEREMANIIIEELLLLGRGHGFSTVIPQ